MMSSFDPTWLWWLGGAVATALFVAWRRSVGRSAQAARRGTRRASEVLRNREFNALAAEAFRMQGYQIVETDAGADADLVLRRDRETMLVLTRYWRAHKVDVEPLVRLHGSMVARGASAGIAVTSGRFARAGVGYAEGNNIKLIEGHALQGLLDKARSGRAERKIP